MTAHTATVHATAADPIVSDAEVKAARASTKPRTSKRARPVYPEATARVVTPDTIVPEDVSPLKATIDEDAVVEQHLRERLAHEMSDLWSKLEGKISFNLSDRAKTILLVIAKVLMYAVGAVATAVLITSLSTILQGWGWNMFIIAVIELAGFILGCIASWYASDAIIDFVAKGGVKRNVDRVFGKVSGFFSRDSKPSVTAS